MSIRITGVRAREVFDSRGRPTVEAELETHSSVRCRAIVPSGASTGAHEAIELRDGNPARFKGLGVRQAVENVRGVIAPAMAGREFPDQRSLDEFLLQLDGTANKSRLGANALLAVSIAGARAHAAAAGLPVWRTIAPHETPTLPMPMVNMISGGLHASRVLDFQDFLVVPIGALSYSAALEMALTFHAATAEEIASRGMSTLKADEGGYGPSLTTNREALELLMKAAARARLQPGLDFAFALDVASTHFYDKQTGVYRLAAEQRSCTARQMVDLLDEWTRDYPIVSIEDGLAEDDWDGWQMLTERMGTRVQLLGDDLFTTNRERLKRGIDTRIANAVLVKMNQIGTLSETLDVVAMAKAAGYATVISARSGETEDPFLAELAVGCAGGQIKVGSVWSSERLSKYNELLRIEEQLGQSAFARWPEGTRNENE